MHSESYSLEALIQVTATSRQVLAMYCEHGLIAPLGEEGEPQFDDQALHQVRRLEYLRAAYGANVEGLRAICALLRRVDELETEVRFLRARS